MIRLLKQLRLDECGTHAVAVRLVCKALLVGLLLSVGGAAHRGAHGTGAFSHGHGARHCPSDDAPPVNASGAALRPPPSTCANFSMQQLFQMQLVARARRPPRPIHHSAVASTIRQASYFKSLHTRAPSPQVTCSQRDLCNSMYKCTPRVETQCSRF